MLATAAIGLATTAPATTAPATLGRCHDRKEFAPRFHLRARRGEVARRVQLPRGVQADRLFLNPLSAAWDLGPFRLLAESRAADGGLGGDFHAFRMRGAKRLAVVIGDACGRGAAAATLLPRVLASLEQSASSTERPS